MEESMKMLQDYALLLDPANLEELIKEAKTRADAIERYEIAKKHPAPQD